jgi:hypothetical protein
MIAEEELSAASLPSQVVHEVDVPHEVRLFEADDVAILIPSHRCAS